MIYSLEAEQSVIGACLLDPEAVGRALEVVAAEDFLEPRHATLFAAMTSLQAKNQVVDVVSVGEEVEKSGQKYDMAYAMEVAGQTPGSANVGVYARIVKDKAKRRNLNELLEHFGQVVRADSKVTFEAMTAQLAEQIGALQVVGGDGTRPLNEIIKSMIVEWQRRAESDGGMDGLATGLEKLDERFLGLKAGNLVVVAGRPSMGKSVLAFQIALHNAANNNLRCMVFSLEMSGEELVERGVASVGRINANKLRVGTSSWEDEDHGKVTFATNKVKTSALIIDDTPGLHVNQICARARAEHRRSPLSLVVVDHINIAKGDGQSREREIAHITGSLKGLAKELRCPVIAVTQLNRKVEERPNKRPMMSDLRDSGAIEQDADIITLLYRDEYYNEDSVSKGVIEIITGKFRGGEVGTDYCASVLAQCRIDNLAPEYMASCEQAAQTKKPGFKY